jgi:hypothetical protein
MSKKPESSEVWKQKAMNVESQLNILFPKFSSQNYPHHMLKLELATTLIGIHLGLLQKLAILYRSDGSYTQ